VKDTNLDNSENNKKLHYRMIKNYFLKDSTDKKDFYNLKNREEIKQDLKKRNMWKIYTSTLDEILNNDTKISNVVDVGCGIGNFIFELSTRKQFKKIVGIDFLSETIKIAFNNQNYFRNIYFIQGDMLNLPFNDCSFNLTICLDTIHHIHKDDLWKAIQELTRITNKYLMIEIRNKDFILEFWYKKILLPKYYSDLPQYSTTITELNDFMKSKGFTQILSRGLRTLNKTNRRIVLVYKKNG
jgi:ubiquinone/menaquinone biosynthesis C-methylase UbiE